MVRKTAKAFYLSINVKSQYLFFVNGQQFHKEFIFNNKIDKDLLNSLYEDDYNYIEEIFSITLTQLKPDLVYLENEFAAGDIAQLRKVVHKIKPSFGFVGIPATQELCKKFEELCANANSVEQVKAEYIILHQQLVETVIAIESDYEKLKDYNQSIV